MNKTQEELSAKETEISTAEEELVQAKVDEDEQYNSMKKRIKYMYEGGNTQFLEILMSSSNIGDLLNKAEYVSKLSSYDRDMLTAFQDTVKAVEEKEAKLQDEYEKLNTLQSSLVSQQTEAQTLISSKEAQIAEIQDQITDNANLLADLKAKAEEAKRLQEEQAAAAAAAAAAAKKNNSGSSSGGSSSSRPASSGNVVSGSGYFTHPCPGMTYQSSYFGEVRSFDSRPHKGNDYAAISRTDRRAGRLPAALLRSLRLPAVRILSGREAHVARPPEPLLCGGGRLPDRPQPHRGGAAMPSSRTARGASGRARTLFCRPRRTRRDRTLTPRPCSTIEITALSDT